MKRYILGNLLNFERKGRYWNWEESIAFLSKDGRNLSKMWLWFFKYIHYIKWYPVMEMDYIINCHLGFYVARTIDHFKKVNNYIIILIAKVRLIRVNSRW